MASSTVTLDKTYFETLLRRAQFHTSGVEYATPMDQEYVTIPKAEHDELLSTARHYENLCRNLFRGGIEEETLAVLIKDDKPNEESAMQAVNEGALTPVMFQSTVDDAEHGNAFLTSKNPSFLNDPAASTSNFVFGPNAIPNPHNGDQWARQNNHFQEQVNAQGDYKFMPEDPANDYGTGVPALNYFHRSTYQKHCNRTLQLFTLAESTSHGDIANAVRGGMLLDIYLRPHDRICHISFLEEEDAQNFFGHVKRHDLYIKGKRVNVRWHDRHFILPVPVSNRIGSGASRNIILQPCDDRHTEEAIRSDLEHIHNLVIISVTLKDKKAYISTNSVHSALYARTCMMSQLKYRTLKISFYSDECAAPLEKPLQVRRENEAPKKPAPPANRFALLNMDEPADGPDHDEDYEDYGTSHQVFEPILSSTIAGVVV